MSRRFPGLDSPALRAAAEPVSRRSLREMGLHHGPDPQPAPPAAGRATVVLHVGGLRFATEAAEVEHAICRQPGVIEVLANPSAQTATVTYDPGRTSVAALQLWVEECGYHCAGQSVPLHLCDPLAEPAAAGPGAPHVEAAPHVTAPDEAMGHGGHAGMSMDAMVRDMRNRFLVAAVLSVPILLWSRIGRDVLGFEVPAPFGLRDDVFQLLLSLPVIGYSAWIFFDGAVRALRQRTLDMMVLVAVAIGTGWLYSLVVTLCGGGDVFYEAATVLATFVLLGHWFEMRARGGANDAVRALLDLAPPMAVVLRAGEPVEVPTAEVAVGDLLLIRPGARVPVDAVVEEGESEVDESMVTGESMPVSKSPGSELVGATINRNGTLRARAARVGADTALAQIVKMVQEAQNSKTPGPSAWPTAQPSGWSWWPWSGAQRRCSSGSPREPASTRRSSSPSPSSSSPARMRLGWPRPPRSWSAGWPSSSGAAAGWRWSATASTTLLRWPRPTWAWPSGPAPTWRRSSQKRRSCHPSSVSSQAFLPTPRARGPRRSDGTLFLELPVHASPPAAVLAADHDQRPPEA